jgi:hypothetical protein
MTASGGISMILDKGWPGRASEPVLWRALGPGRSRAAPGPPFGCRTKQRLARTAEDLKSHRGEFRPPERRKPATTLKETDVKRAWLIKKPLQPPFRTPFLTPQKPHHKAKTTNGETRNRTEDTTIFRDGEAEPRSA